MGADTDVLPQQVEAQVDQQDRGNRLGNMTCDRRQQAGSLLWRES